MSYARLGKIERKAINGGVEQPERNPKNRRATANFLRCTILAVTRLFAGFWRTLFLQVIAIR
jgi:hypothetical protein